MLAAPPASVLNESDTSRKHPPTLAGMDESAPVSAAVNRLWTPRLSLSACTRGVMLRDTRGLALTPAQRLSYYPASPLCAIHCVFEGAAEIVRGPFPERPARLDDPREPLPTGLVLVGPHAQPTVCWNPGPVHVLTLVLMPDALQLLTGLDPASLVNRITDARGLLPTEWQAMLDALAALPDEDARVQHMQDFLDPRWQAVRPKQALQGQRYADWAQGLVLRAAQSSAGRSLRQVERRIKAWAGQPMRDLQRLSRIEQAFFAATRTAADSRVRWVDVAADTGYADQSHLSRASRRVTGFSPEDLRRRIRDEEPFWLYRLWGN
jgi:AraC-like DNA-binding protein